MSDSLKQKTVSGVLWSAVSRFSTQGIQFIFNILIARILLPEDYGVVAMLSIFLAVSQAFIDSGFANALIQKKDRKYSYSINFALAISICVELLKRCQRGVDLPGLEKLLVFSYRKDDAASIRIAAKVVIN